MASKISLTLSRTLSELPPNQATTVLVMFDEKLTLEQRDVLSRPGTDRRERLEILRTSSEKAQEHTFEFLRKEGRDFLKGVRNVDFDVSKIQRFENLNAIALVANYGLVNRLDKEEDVYAIMSNQKFNLVSPMRTPQSVVDLISPQEMDEGFTWGLKHLQIDKIWDEYGFKGDGILIGHLDTGVYAEHPDLKGKIEKWTFIDPLANLRNGAPFDTNQGSHGTHTAGTIVGGNASGVHIGVAPGAKLVSAGILLAEESFLKQILEGVSWVTNNDVSIISISLGDARYELGFNKIFERLVLLDILPVVAIGNNGYGNTRSPGNSPHTIGVGAVDWEGEVASFSGGAGIEGVIKPNICAPGVAVYSSIETENYIHDDGTSMATPHVAGVAALLLEAIQQKSIAMSAVQLRDLIYQHADNKSDMRYGGGIIHPINTLKSILEL
jgi:subtilisin